MSNIPPKAPVSMDDVLPEGKAGPPLALPVALEEPTGDIPMALPIEMNEGPAQEDIPVAVPVAPLLEAARAEQAPVPIACPACQTNNPAGQPFCSDCGYYFSEADLAAAVPAQSGNGGV